MAAMQSPSISSTLITWVQLYRHLGVEGVAARGAVTLWSTSLKNETSILEFQIDPCISIITAQATVSLARFFFFLKI